MKPGIVILSLSLFALGCTSKENEQLTQQQKDQITKEVKSVADAIWANIEKKDAAWFLDYYVDSPNWGMANADGSRYDFQYTTKIATDFGPLSSFKWTTLNQDFKILTKDLVLCAWDGKDEYWFKSGEKMTHNPHAYTILFKNIDGQWKVIYQHDSGIPVTQTVHDK